MTEILIEANRISKIYDQDIFLKRGQNFYALNQVDFILKEGDFISIMGPSGSGKSTLLNCISMLDTVSKGFLSILGNAAYALKDKQISTFRYEYLGFIFQNHNLIPTLSMYDNIASPIMLGNIHPKEIHERIEKLAKKLHIEDILFKFPNQCSVGQKQRAAIARALVNNPKIILCDEPTGNLDSYNSHEVLNILSDLNKQGISIVIVTHDAMIASYAKKLMYLRDGQMQTIVYRDDAKQIDFYNEIVKISMEDSVFKLFNKDANMNIHEIDKSKIRKKQIDNTQRKKREEVYAQIDSETINNQTINYRKLNVSSEGMTYTNVSHHKKKLLFSNIDKITLSLKPVYSNFGFLSEYYFYVKLDIVMKEETEVFLLMNTNDLTPLFIIFKEHKIPVEDPIGIQNIYIKYSDHLVRTRYLHSQLKRLKKEYGIK